MALLEAYFDESGTHAGSPITAIAGYVSTKDGWNDLERLWLEELKLPSNQGLKVIHLHHALVGKDKGYERITEPNRVAHVRRVSEILKASDIKAIGVWVDTADWSAVTDAAFLSSFPTPYDLCFEHIVHFLRRWSIENTGGELVSPVFGWTNEFAPRTAARYGAQTWYRDVLGRFAFDYPDRTIPLQAADFVAHQIRADADRSQYEVKTLDNIGMNVALANATERHGVDMFRGYDANALAGAVRRFTLTGKIL